jgi:Leucine-rich repeat (LRR) protein
MLGVALSMYPATSWGLCYYLIDQAGNVQSSIYPPYDLSYPVDQLSPAERAQRAQRGHLVIGARVPTCGTTPFPQPKIVKTQPVDSNKKIDNTTTAQNAPPLKKPLTPTEIQEATKKPIEVVQKDKKSIAQQALDTVIAVNREATQAIAGAILGEELAQKIKPQSPIKEITPIKRADSYEGTYSTEPKKVETPKTEEKPVSKPVKQTSGETQPAVSKTAAKTEQPVQTPAVAKVETSPQTKSLKITEQMAIQTLQAIDESLSKRDMVSYRKHLADSLEVGELRGGGKSKMQVLTAQAYSKQLEQALSKIARYELKHHNPKITINGEKDQAVVHSEVRVRLEFQDALETSKTYGEITTFNLVKDQLLLSRLEVLANSGKSSKAPTILVSPPSDQKTLETQSTICNDVKEISHAECQSLVELYETTGGEKWKNRKNWLKTKTPCQWIGVTCENNSVVSLKLSKNKLSGTMPKLNGLVALRTLDLSRNNLIGTLPPLNVFSQLQVLSLDNNNLSGKLPDISQLKNIQTIELQKNQLTGNLPNLDSLLELEELNLSDNQFVGELPSLKKMNKLQKLAIYNNQLTGNLPALDQLVSLKSMHLSGNHLTGQIPDVSNLLQLESLNLSVNQLSGSLPTGLNKLLNLKWLQLESNQLSGRIPDLRDLHKLHILRLQNNQLCGEIPEGLRLSGLKDVDSELQIENNHLTATNQTLLSFLESKIANWQTTQKPQNCETTPTQ